MLNQKKGTKKVYVVLTVVVVLLVLLVLLQKKPLLEKKEAVKIGFIGDFSNDKMATETALVAVKIAMEDINKIYNKKYELVIFDVNKNSKEDVENAFKRVSNENMLAIISKFNPTNNPANEKIPTIYVRGTKKENTTMDKFYWGIRLFFITSDYVDQHVKLMERKYNLSSTAFITDNSDWLSDDFMKNVESFSKIQTSTYFFDEAKIDNALNDIKQKNPDIIMLLTSDANAIRFLKKARENSMENKLFLAFVSTDVSLLIEEDSMPERLIISPPPADKVGPVDSVSDAFGEFNRKIFLLTNREATNLQLNAYDATTLMAYAISKASISNKPENIKEDREKIIKELWATRNFESLRGILNPDGKTGYFKRNYIKTFYIKNGRFESAKGVTV